ncbi:MAG: secretin N-terminal domain-containing protein [Planctomycetota bacterium]
MIERNQDARRRRRLHAPAAWALAGAAALALLGPGIPPLDLPAAIALQGGLAAGPTPDDPPEEEDAPPRDSAPPPVAMSELRCKGAEIDTIVTWLAERTGKSIIKHKDVDCKLNVLSPDKVPVEEAVRLVYRALALEGFSALETRNVIVIVPEKMESKVTPEFLDGGDDVAQGRQTVLRIFRLEHAQAAKLKEKLKAVLSEKAKLEVDERANKIIVTDYAQNVRFLEELIRELDITTDTDTVIEIFALKHTEASEMARLLNAVFGGSPAAATAGKRGGQPRPPQPKKPGKKGAQTVAPAVKILADNTSNRLVVTAPAEKMQEVRDLIATLDSEKPADVAVRVVPLMHVDAEELVGEIGPMYTKLRGSSLKEVIEIAANERSNSLIVLSSESNFSAIKKLVAALDTEEAENKLMRTFPLRFADAEDVAEQLEELHDTTPSYGYYWYSRNDRNRRGRTKFVANRRRNEVIVIGAPGALERIAEIIETLDQPVGDEELAPRIYPLKYVGAADVKEVLDEILLKKTQARPYWYNPYDTQEERDVGRLYGKVRIAAEPYSNSLIVTSNSVENFAAVEGILRRLDTRSEDNETTLTMQLRHAKAVAVANNINILFARGGSPPRRPQRQQQRNAANRQANPISSTGMSFELEEDEDEETFFPWLGGQQNRGRDGRRARPVSDLVGKVRIVPDVRTNSLMVTTSPHYFPSVLKLVNDLDIPTAQVLIEAKIIEVSRDDRERLGVRWSPDGDRSFDGEDFDDSLLATGAAEYLETFLGSRLADAMRTGVFDAAVDLDLLVQFLTKNTNSRVRAEPRLNVADNERGKLFVGSRVPFISGSLNTPEGGRSDSFRYVDVGIILEVTPHINANGEVDLSVRVESSQIRPGETLFGGAILDTRNYRTDLSVDSGKTLVLGGIIQREETKIVRRVPILGHIPIIGWLFRKKDTTVRDVELMVFLRPTVTRTPEEVERLMRDEGRKLRQIRDWEEELKISGGRVGESEASAPEEE